MNIFEFSKLDFLTKHSSIINIICAEQNKIYVIRTFSGGDVDDLSCFLTDKYGVQLSCGYFPKEFVGGALCYQVDETTWLFPDALESRHIFLKVQGSQLDFMDTWKKADKWNYRFRSIKCLFHFRNKYLVSGIPRDSTQETELLMIVDEYGQEYYSKEVPQDCRVFPVNEKSYYGYGNSVVYTLGVPGSEMECSKYLFMGGDDYQWLVDLEFDKDIQLPFKFDPGPSVLFGDRYLFCYPKKPAVVREPDLQDYLFRYDIVQSESAEIEIPKDVGPLWGLVILEGNQVLALGGYGTAKLSECYDGLNTLINYTDLNFLGGYISNQYIENNNSLILFPQDLMIQFSIEERFLQEVVKREGNSSFLIKENAGRTFIDECNRVYQIDSDLSNFDEEEFGEVGRDMIYIPSIGDRIESIPVPDEWEHAVKRDSPCDRIDELPRFYGNPEFALMDPAAGEVRGISSDGIYGRKFTATKEQSFIEVSGMMGYSVYIRNKFQNNRWVGIFYLAESTLLAGETHTLIYRGCINQGCRTKLISISLASDWNLTLIGLSPIKELLDVEGTCLASTNTVCNGKGCLVFAIMLEHETRLSVFDYDKLAITSILRIRGVQRIGMMCSGVAPYREFVCYTVLNNDRWSLYRWYLGDERALKVADNLAYPIFVMEENFARYQTTDNKVVKKRFA